jgi:hypothetical protein
MSNKNKVYNQKERNLKTKYLFKLSSNQTQRPAAVSYLE